MQGCAATADPEGLTGAHKKWSGHVGMLMWFTVASITSLQCILALVLKTKIAVTSHVVVLSVALFAGFACQQNVVCFIAWHLFCYAGPQVIFYKTSLKFLLLNFVLEVLSAFHEEHVGTCVHLEE